MSSSSHAQKLLNQRQRYQLASNHYRRFRTISLSTPFSALPSTSPSGATAVTTEWVIEQLQNNLVIAVDLDNDAMSGFSKHTSSMLQVWSHMLEAHKKGELHNKTWFQAMHHYKNILPFSTNEQSSKFLCVDPEQEKNELLPGQENTFGYTIVWSRRYEHIIIGRVSFNNQFEEAHHWLEEEKGMTLTLEAARRIVKIYMNPKKEWRRFDNIPHSSLVDHYFQSLDNIPSPTPSSPAVGIFRDLLNPEPTPSDKKLSSMDWDLESKVEDIYRLPSTKEIINRMIKEDISGVSQAIETINTEHTASALTLEERLICYDKYQKAKEYYQEDFNSYYQSDAKTENLDPEILETKRVDAILEYAINLFEIALKEEKDLERCETYKAAIRTLTNSDVAPGNPSILHPGSYIDFFIDSNAGIILRARTLAAVLFLAATDKKENESAPGYGHSSLYQFALSLRDIRCAYRPQGGKDKHACLPGTLGYLFRCAAPFNKWTAFPETLSHQLIKIPAKINQFIVKEFEKASISVKAAFYAYFSNRFLLTDPEKKDGAIVASFLASLRTPDKQKALLTYLANELTLARTRIQALLLPSWRQRKPTVILGRCIDYLVLHAICDIRYLDKDILPPGQDFAELPNATIRTTKEPPKLLEQEFSKKMMKISGTGSIEAKQEQFLNEAWEWQKLAGQLDTFLHLIDNEVRKAMVFPQYLDDPARLRQLFNLENEYLTYCKKIKITLDQSPEEVSKVIAESKQITELVEEITKISLDPTSEESTVMTESKPTTEIVEVKYEVSVEEKKFQEKIAARDLKYATDNSKKAGVAYRFLKTLQSVAEEKSSRDVLGKASTEPRMLVLAKTIVDAAMPGSHYIVDDYEIVCLLRLIQNEVKSLDKMNAVLSRVSAILETHSRYNKDRAKTILKMACDHFNSLTGANIYFDVTSKGRIYREDFSQTDIPTLIDRLEFLLKRNHSEERTERIQCLYNIGFIILSRDIDSISKPEAHTLMLLSQFLLEPNAQNPSLGIFTLKAGAEVDVIIKNACNYFITLEKTLHPIKDLFRQGLVTLLDSVSASELIQEASRRGITGPFCIRVSLDDPTMLKVITEQSTFDGIPILIENSEVLIGLGSASDSTVENTMKLKSHTLSKQANALYDQLQPVKAISKQELTRIQTSIAYLRISVPHHLLEEEAKKLETLLVEKRQLIRNGIVTNPSEMKIIQLICSNIQSIADLQTYVGNTTEYKEPMRTLENKTNEIRRTEMARLRNLETSVKLKTKKLVAVLDCDGTLTKKSGEDLFHFFFSKNMTLMKLAEKDFTNLTAQDKAYLENFLNKNQDCAITIEAVALIRFLLDCHVPIAIATRNYAGYVHFLLEYAGFTDEEINKIKIQDRNWGSKKSSVSSWMRELDMNPTDTLFGLALDDTIKDREKIKNALETFCLGGVCAFGMEDRKQGVFAWKDIMKYICSHTSIRQWTLSADEWVKKGFLFVPPESVPENNHRPAAVHKRSKWFVSKWTRVAEQIYKTTDRRFIPGD